MRTFIRTGSIQEVCGSTPLMSTAMIKTDWYNRNSQSMEGQRGTADAVPLCLKLNIFRLYRQAGAFAIGGDGTVSENACCYKSCFLN